MADNEFSSQSLADEEAANDSGAGGGGTTTTTTTSTDINPGWSTRTNADGTKTVYDADGNPVYTLDANNVMISGPGMGSTTADLTGGTGTDVTGANNDLTKIFNSLAGTKLTDKQFAALGIGAGGLAGLLGANTGQRNPVGYQGGIDMSKQVVRQQVPAPTTPRAYGAPAMGRRYFTDTQFTNPAGLAAAQTTADTQAQQLAATQQPKPIQAAQGGLMAAAQGRYLRGDTDGMADKIRTSIDGEQPAALSHGEFVIPADVVSHLGNGNSDAGAKKLKEMMGRVRQARTGTTKQGKEINPNKFMPGGLAQAHYAAGGDVTGSAINAGLTGTESNLSNWAGPYVTNMLGQGQALANAPYQAYTGQLTAGTSPLQQQAFNTATNLQTPAGINQAGTTAGNIANTAQNLAYNPTTTTFGNEQAQQYMNPYLKMALDPQMAELQRQNQIANMNANAKLTQAGGFGGGRQAVMNAENTRNMMQQMNTTLGQGYATAFDKAQAQFNADQARKMQEAQFGANYGLQGLQTGLQAAGLQGQMGTAQNQAQLANLGALSGLGATQRGIEQEALAADKAQFEEERANPYKMVQFQQSLLQGLPLAAQNYNVAQPSVLQQLAGGTSGLATLLGNLGYTIPGSTPAK
jgi:hypothetical protein